MVKYNACNFFMIRTPLISVNSYTSMFDDPTQLNTRLKEAFNNPLLREALAVSSEDLLKALDKLNDNDLSVRTKATEQIRSSLIRYFIRLSTRPTPFGLFSGISMGQFSDVSNITISEPCQNTKRARPDMEWVYGLIKKIEANKSIRSHLNVKFNDFTYTSGNRIEKPNKTFLQASKSNDNVQESTSIRYTGQVKMIEENCKNYSIFSNVLEEIASKNPSVPIIRIETFLSQLLENEYLISELRPSLMNTDMLDCLIGVLSKIAGVSEVDFYLGKLNEIRTKIAEYNATNIGDGLDVYNDVIQLQKDLFQCKNYLQVDMKTNTVNNTLDSELKKELERFASAMYKLAPTDRMSDEQADYVNQFLEKYGYSAEVPILELLDVDKGLGAPAHFQVNTINRPIPQRQKPIKEQRLTALMDKKLLTTLREGKNVIEITDEDIEYICKGEQQVNLDHSMDYLQSFELYLIAHPGADNYFTLAPMPMSDGFGKTFGRFSDMFTEEESLLLNSGFTTQKELLQEYVVAEIAELPSRGRISNVSINNSDYDYQIALTTSPCEGKHLLSVRDLYIGIEREGNRFYVKSKSLNKKVIVTMTCMMNPSFGSNVFRFLREISTMRRKNVTYAISNVMNSKFEYSPRITYGKIVIKPETWAISNGILGIVKSKDKDAFEKKLVLYCEKWAIPQHVFLNEGDNRLLIDLSNPVHRNEIFNVLKKNTSIVTLTELGCNLSDYASTGADGKYITEIVLPFFASVDSPKESKKSPQGAAAEVLKTLSNVSANRMSIKREQLLLLPGNEKWIYFKLYGGSKRLNELISLAYETLEKYIADGLAQKYFFIRYSDPEPHLRLRVQPTEKGQHSLYFIITHWLGTLYTDGLISKVVSDSYIRETERYGGHGLIEYAENYFYSNSKFVMNILTKQRYGEMLINMDYLGISFIIATLEAFGLSINEQEKLLSSKVDKSSYKKDFQNDRKMIMRAVDSSDNWFDIRSSIQNPEIYDLLTANSQELKKYASAVFDADQRGELTNSIEEIASSIIHMFCNRLIGNNSWEARKYALAMHGVCSFNGFLKHRNKSLELELPEGLI